MREHYRDLFGHLEADPAHRVAATAVRHRSLGEHFRGQTPVRALPGVDVPALFVHGDRALQ